MNYLELVLILQKDKLISKIIQFLSTREDKRKFKVYPIKNEYLNNEPIIFETEVYNDIYERTYGHKVDIRITDEKGSMNAYSYVTNSKNSRYRIGNLGNGIFKYSATSVIKGQTATSTGSFTVKDLQIETTKLTADHNLLKNIAALNGGSFYEKSELNQLADDIQSQEMINKIYSSEKYLSIINMKWGFFILIIFVSTEWFLRKYHGSY